MLARSKGLIAAAILTVSTLAHAQDAIPAPAPVKLVWLITDEDRAPLGVFVWPVPMTMKACAARAVANGRLVYTPFEKRVGDYIAHRLDTNGLMYTGPLCLTTEEAAKLVQAVKEQEIQPEGRDT